MKLNSYLLWFFNSLFFSRIAITIPAQAQITADDSLPVPTEVIKQSDRLTEIMGGTEAGINLFHSFTEFSVEEGNIARFISNNSDIQNVIGRVTGTSVSEIFGQIESGGIAPDFNLFLLNPNGIIFGSDASLNINGSFVATTANAIQFGDRGWFTAANPNDPSLLTIQPSAFFFNQIAANSIQNQSQDQIDTGAEEPLIAGLQVPQDKSLLLLGGNVTMNGGTITAPNGRVELGGLSEKGTVALNTEDNHLSLRFPDNVGRSDVLLTNEAKIDVRDRGSGSIVINGRNIEVANSSTLSSGILENFESNSNEAGKITLRATEKTIVNDSAIESRVEKEAIGNSGDISIEAQSLDLINGGFVLNLVNGRGDLGNISFNISEDITIRGQSSQNFPSQIANAVLVDGKGQGGNITIKAKSLFLSDRAAIQTGTRGIGNAGNVVIRVDDFIFLESSAQINTLVLSGAIGNGGIIDLQARSLSLTKGGNLAASVFRADSENGLPGGQGKGGKITIDVADSVNISGVGINGFSSGIFSNTESGAEGDAGNITIETNSLRLAEGAVINTETENFGSGGNIVINTNTFEAIGGGQIIAQTSSSGNAGNIIINAGESVTLSGSDPTFDERSDRFGTIVSNVGAESGFFVSSQSTGQAGNITVNTPQLTLDEARIDAETAQTGGETGANITLNVADSLQLKNESSISARASDSANGGNVTIDAEFIIAFPEGNNDIIAAAKEGIGGEIDITTSSIFGIAERSSIPENTTNDLDASSEFGIDGTISINELDVNPTESLEELPTEIIDVANLVAQNLCEQGKESEFIVTGKGGIAANPSQVRDSEVSQIDLVEPVAVLEDGEVKNKKQQPFVTTAKNEEIIEAQGWIVNDRGILELVEHQTALNASTSYFNSDLICD